MAKQSRDLWFELKTPTTGWRRIAPRAIYNLPTVLEEEINTEFKKLGTAMLAEIKMAFQIAIRRGQGFRARNSAYKGARPTLLMQRMLPAMVAKMFKEDADTMSLLIFDLARMDKETRGEGRKTHSRGWFLRFTDDHQGRRHGSMKFGFCSLALAKRLAERCIAMMNLGSAEAAEFKAYVARVFKGKHNEGDSEDGIMVELSKPLFFAYPQFGKPRKHGIRPHPGFRSWPVWDRAREMATKNHFKGMLEAALTRAFNRL